MQMINFKPNIVLTEKQNVKLRNRFLCDILTFHIIIMLPACTTEVKDISFTQETVKVSV